MKKIFKQWHSGQDAREGGFLSHGGVLCVENLPIALRYYSFVTSRFEYLISRGETHLTRQISHKLESFLKDRDYYLVENNTFTRAMLAVRNGPIFKKGIYYADKMTIYHNQAKTINDFLIKCDAPKQYVVYDIEHHATIFTYRLMMYRQKKKGSFYFAWPHSKKEQEYLTKMLNFRKIENNWYFTKNDGNMVLFKIMADPRSLTDELHL